MYITMVFCKLKVTIFLWSGTTGSGMKEMKHGNLPSKKDDYSMT